MTHRQKSTLPAQMSRTKQNQIARIEFLTAVLMKILVLWHMIPCILVNIYRSFEVLVTFILRFCAACLLSLVITLYKPILLQFTRHLAAVTLNPHGVIFRKTWMFKIQGFWTYKMAWKNMWQSISDDSVLTHNTGITNNKKETGHDLHHFLRNPLLSLSQSFCLWCILKATVHRSALGHTPYGTTHPAEETELTGVHSGLRLARVRLAEKHNR